MARSIIEKWSHLQIEHMTYDDALNFWKRRLRTYFKNTRGKNKENIPQKKKTFGKKRASEECNGEPLKKAARAWGVANYLPDREAGEDDGTQQSYIEKMASISDQAVHRRSKEQVLFMMGKTFPDRRNMIVQKMAKVSDVIQKYPLLACEEEVRNTYIPKANYIKNVFFCPNVSDILQYI